MSDWWRQNARIAIRRLEYYSRRPTRIHTFTRRRSTRMRRSKLLAWNIAKKLKGHDVMLIRNAIRWAAGQKHIRFDKTAANHAALKYEHFRS
jgi:hypothetical protein